MVYGCVCGALPWSSFQTWISIPLQQDSNAIDRPFVKWWNWNAFQSVFFYFKHSEDGRQMKITLDKSLRLLPRNQVFLFSRRKHRANNFTQEYCSCSPTISFFFSEMTHPFPSKIRRLEGNAVEGGRETWSIRQFVFFLHRWGGLHFMVGRCPERAAR